MSDDKLERRLAAASDRLDALGNDLQASTPWPLAARFDAPAREGILSQKQRQPAVAPEHLDLSIPGRKLEDEPTRLPAMPDRSAEHGAVRLRQRQHGQQGQVEQVAQRVR
jgi:hypothetical protein